MVTLSACAGTAEVGDNYLPETLVGGPRKVVGAYRVVPNSQKRGYLPACVNRCCRGHRTPRQYRRSKLRAILRFGLRFPNSRPDRLLIVRGTVGSWSSGGARLLRARYSCDRLLRERYRWAALTAFGDLARGYRILHRSKWRGVVGHSQSSIDPFFSRRHGL